MEAVAKRNMVHARLPYACLYDTRQWGTQTGDLTLHTFIWKSFNYLSIQTDQVSMKHDLLKQLSAIFAILRNGLNSQRESAHSNSINFSVLLSGRGRVALAHVCLSRSVNLSSAQEMNQRELNQNHDGTQCVPHAHIAGLGMLRFPRQKRNKSELKLHDLSTNVNNVSF